MIATEGKTSTKAKFTHILLNETYQIGSEAPMTIEKAWNLFEFACRRMQWNPIVTDIKVELVAS